MNATNVNQPYLEQALTEHRQIHELARRLRQELHKLPPKPGRHDFERARDGLVALQVRLREHFAQEEEGGYLDEAVSRAPRLAHQADALQKQHAEFVNAIEQVIHAAQQAELGKAAWLHLSKTFDRFAEELEAHEEAEKEILGHAFNTEVA